MKKYLVAIILIISLNKPSRAQYNHYRDQSQFTIGVAKKDIGSGFNMGGQYFIDNGVSIQGLIQYESARPYQAYYNSYGLDAGVSFTPFQLSSDIYVNLKGFGSLAFQKITDKQLISASSFNYGGKIGGGLEYYINESAAVEFYALQGFFAKKVLAQKVYEFGLLFKIIL